MIFADNLLQDKVAIVTGGGTGIGKAIADQFARLGARLTISSRKREHLDPAAEELRVHGGECLAITADIREPEQVEAMVDRTLEKFGRIDILVNNAGGQFASPAAVFSTKGWDTVIKTNLNGTWYVTQTVANKWMIPHGGGKIITIVVNFWRGMPGMAHTSAARAGIVNLTKSLAVEWAQFKILLNAVAPGTIDSSGLVNYPKEVVEQVRYKIPLKRLGSCDEIASAVTFLASPAGDFITGETIAVDGGASLWGDLWPIPD